ncbi:MAG: folate hydrolase, partial [Bacteroidota bacterium]|nr:folate hydrolase [Bacteroidota bacterium]
AKDPKKNYKSPVAKSPVPFLNFSSIENALVQLKNSAEEFQKLWTNAVLLSVDKQKMLNAILYKAERHLLNDKGLPRRAWYRHQVYAPGFYTGYGVKTLPGVREGIEQRNWNEAQQHIEIVATTLQSYTSQINQAIALLK